jgi:segregation and condensation protein A
MPSTYTVAVGSFEGPFDLLLQLIARRKVDIYDIPIAEITDEYLAVLREMESVDLETTTEFLVVAATLVELKAARLLPAEDDPELDELALEARDLLYARLLEYRTFKQASGWIAKRLAALHGYVARTAGPDPEFRHVQAPLELSVSAEQLAEMAARALAEQPGQLVDVSHLQPIRMTVQEAADLVMNEVTRAGGRASFRELTAGCRHRVEVIACFLALLELYKFEHIDLAQADNFGDLVVDAVDLDRWGRDRSAGVGMATSIKEDHEAPRRRADEAVDEDVTSRAAREEARGV